jgi:hypothetical protein
MNNASDIQETMDQAAHALGALPEEEWAEWVVYLLETLENRVEGEEYRGFLEVLRLAITTRLEEDLW